MREIKFRAWVPESASFRKGNGGMYSGFSFRDIYSGIEESRISAYSGPNGGYLEEPKWNEIIFEQFTGLHDKNGKEIYEGDIIHHYLGVDVVKWDVDGFTVGDYEPRGLEDFLHTCEVIGNIHENPELLEANK